VSEKVIERPSERDLVDRIIDSITITTCALGIEFGSKLPIAADGRDRLAKMVEAWDESRRADTTQADAETVRALEDSTKQLEAMNCSASHAASWVEPKSDATTKQIERNKSALSRLSAGKGEK
jgi:hypothetical protein